MWFRIKKNEKRRIYLLKAKYTRKKKKKKMGALSQGYSFYLKN